MKVSCMCATYNRPPNYQWLLEEAIESFLRQDYAEKELIVLNDCAGQELVCDAPDVVVINLPRRFAPGREAQCRDGAGFGSLITKWDDDDISLPWRLSKSIERLADADYYNPHVHWFLNAQGLHTDHVMGICQNCSLFTRSAFDAVGGYPHTSVDNDLVIHWRLRSHPDVKQAKPSVLRAMSGSISIAGVSVLCISQAESPIRGPNALVRCPSFRGAMCSGHSGRKSM